MLVFQRFHGRLSGQNESTVAPKHLSFQTVAHAVVNIPLVYGGTVSVCPGGNNGKTRRKKGRMMRV